jgi:hypothetical protein
MCMCVCCRSRNVEPYRRCRPARPMWVRRLAGCRHAHQGVWSHRRCRGASAAGQQRVSQTRRTSVATDPPWAHRSRRPNRRRENQPSDQPVWPPGPTTQGPTTYASALPVSRTITSARMGEALFGGDDLHTHAPLYTFRERSQTLAWAKPCLAGRPTMLVRTQPPEQHTSRSRPSGMELPDYPVVVLTPSRRTRMGPHFTFPPGLFPDSYLVLLPVGFLVLVLVLVSECAFSFLD